jgi:prevent-host-death family protein
MKTMAAGQFKARCLKVMDQVRATREPVTITKKGRPVAKLVPADGQPEDIFGCLKGEIEIVGDVVSPAVSLEDWEVLR